MFVWRLFIPHVYTVRVKTCGRRHNVVPATNVHGKKKHVVDIVWKGIIL